MVKELKLCVEMNWFCVEEAGGCRGQLLVLHVKAVVAGDSQMGCSWRIGLLQNLETLVQVVVDRGEGSDDGWRSESMSDQ